MLALLQFVMTPLARVDPGFTGLPTFATFLWIVVASVLLFRRERASFSPGVPRRVLS